MRNQTTKGATPMGVGRRAVGVVVIALALGSCGDDRAPTEIRDPVSTISGPSLATIGGASASLQFLPPIAARQPSIASALNTSLLPHLSVEICRLANGSCAALVRTFGADDRSSERLRIENDEITHFHVNWHTSRNGLSAGTYYRITVRAAGHALGHADAYVANTVQDLKRVDASKYVPIRLGSTLPIKFHIGDGVQVIGPAGGTSSFVGDAVTLQIGEGVLDASVAITVDPIADAPDEPGVLLVGGATYDFGPDGFSFPEPVQLTIAYNEANLPVGVPEHALALLHFTNGRWEAIPGSAVNTTANTISGPVTSFSPYAPGVPAKLAFLVQPSNTTGGHVISPAIQVEIQDGAGALVTTATNAITLTLAGGSASPCVPGPNPCPAPATLSGTTTVLAVNGVATFSDLSIQKPGTGYTLAASSVLLTGATSAAFDITPAVPTKLAWRVQPSNVTALQGFSPLIEVEIQDAAGVRVVTATNTVKFMITGPNVIDHYIGDAVAVDGIVRFNVVLCSATGTYTLTASADGLTSAISNTFAITAGAAYEVKFLDPVSDIVTAGVAISPLVEATIFDFCSNRVTTASLLVSIALRSNPTGATLHGTTTVAAINGVATFDDLSIWKAGFPYSLKVSADGLGQRFSNSFYVVAGPFGSISPSNPTVEVGQTIRLAAADAFGNPTGAPVVWTTPIGQTIVTEQAGAPAGSIDLIGNAIGQVNVTATAGGKTATTTVTVKPALTTLPTLGGDVTIALGINDAGQVVGFSTTAIPGSQMRAFLWMPNAANGTTGTMVNLGTLPGHNESQALGINSSGQVVGWSGINGVCTARRAFRWTPSAPGSTTGTMTDLGTLADVGGQLYASYNRIAMHAINDAGETVGDTQIDCDLTSSREVLWRPGFGLTWGSGGAYRDINSVGQRVGWAFFFSSGNLRRAAIAPPTSLLPTELGTLGGLESEALGINAGGKVVGWTDFSGGRAFLWTPSSPNATTGTMENLGPLGGGASRAHDINNSDEIVGFSNERAFVWKQGSGMQDLGIPSGDFGSRAFAINNKSQVVGYSINIAATRAVIWRFRRQ